MKFYVTKCETEMILSYSVPPRTAASVLKIYFFQY